MIAVAPGRSLSGRVVAKSQKFRDVDLAGQILVAHQIRCKCTVLVPTLAWYLGWPCASCRVRPEQQSITESTSPSPRLLPRARSEPSVWSCAMSAPNKTKPSPPASSTASDTQAPSAASIPDSHSEAPSDSESLHDARSDRSVAASTATTSSQSNRWLAGTASWRSKAPASIKSAPPPSSESTKRRRDDSPTKFLTKRKSSKSEVIPASTTKVHVSSDGLVDDPPEPNPEETPENAQEPPTPVLDEPPLPPEPSIQQEAPANAWRWRSWWSRPDGYSEADKLNPEEQGSAEAAQSTPLPGPTPSEEPDAETKGLGGSTITADKSQDVNMTDTPQEAVPGPSSDSIAASASTAEPSGEALSNSSWFRLWSSAQNAGARAVPAVLRMNNSSTATLDKSAQSIPEQPAESTVPQDTASLSDGSVPSETVSPPSTVAASTKPSAWAFWYRDKAIDDKKLAEGKPQKHVGEVAVFDTPSQSHPEAAQFNEQTQPQTPTLPEPQVPAKQEPLAKRSLRSLRVRSKPQNTLNDDSTIVSSSSKPSTPTQSSPVLGPTKPETAAVIQSASKQPAKVKQEPLNLLLPEFKTTYQLVQQPSFWKQVRQYFLGGEPATPHLHINPAPPRIKKALAIGIHGFFPAPIIQKVIGQPTGTSIRFANAAATAIKDWSAARGYEPEIEQIALEGEGFIAERVNSLWKLLLNWIEHLKAADFILFACHSQGVPVTIMLVAKLIQFGCVHATRIGICAMAGVNMGPFIEYKTKYFGPTAAELFEFSNPKSLVSQMYLASLDEALRFGVRILYVGSIDDQLVSLEVSHASS